MYFLLEIIGTIAFAISGANRGIKAKMDILGVVVLGLTTAVGGGLLRDLIIGVTPPMCFQSPIYAILSIVVSLIVFIPTIRQKVNPNSWFLTVMDAIGLGIFTVIGVRAGIGFQNFFLAQFLGVITGVGGGIFRDIFAMEKPMIFVRHFYAMASIIGAIIATIIMPINETIAMVVGIIVVVTLRLLASKYNWNLPRA